MRMSNSVFSFTISETNGDITAVSLMLRVTEEPRGPVEKIIVIEMHLQLLHPKAMSLGEFLICTRFGTSKRGEGWVGCAHVGAVALQMKSRRLSEVGDLGPPFLVFI